MLKLSLGAEDVNPRFWDTAGMGGCRYVALTWQERKLQRAWGGGAPHIFLFSPYLLVFHMGPSFHRPCLRFLLFSSKSMYYASHGSNFFGVHCTHLSLIFCTMFSLDPYKYLC